MEKERPGIRAVQRDNLRCLLGMRRMDKVPNARIRELWGMTKGLVKVLFSDDSAMWREWRRTGLVRGSIRGVPRKRWIDTGRTA